jgi:SagB-type dehydrogenase family enzyme
MYLKPSEVREQTLLTPQGVAHPTRFLDWDTQPSSYKKYPHFCYRIALRDYPELQWLSEIRKVSDKRRLGNTLYHRLNVPSAGNLHPIEVYVQIRNVSGVLSGIYHLDTLDSVLVMIREIGSEGIEPELGREERFSGVIVMFSIVPFRSYWKYALRAWRYLYLDLGHQIGVFNTLVRHFGLNLLPISPSNTLNAMMGLGEDEYIGAVYGVGEWSERRAKRLDKPLMKVQPTDYTQMMDSLIASIQTIAPYTDIPETKRYERILDLNSSRRSAREFNPLNIRDVQIQMVMESKVPESLEIVFVNLQAHSMQVAEMVHLLLDQHFIAGASVVALIYSAEFCPSSHIEAGIYAQELYMICEENEMGCSGIGAFYDNEALRWSDKALLYAVAIGGKV